MPEPKRNPNPQEIYEIRITVEDAPVTLPIERVYADYEVLDESCLPVTNAIAGTKDHPTHSEPLELAPAADGGFVARVATDLLIDEDYFGLGECRWQLVQVAAQARVGSRKYHASISGDQLDSPGDETTLYDKDFVGVGLADNELLDIGQPPDAVPRPRSEYFSITLTARKTGK